MFNRIYYQLFLALIALGLATGCNKPLPDPAPQFSEVDKIRKDLTAGTAAGPGAAAVPVGTGWGTIRGRFVFDGDAPEAKALAVSGQNMCKKDLKDNSLLIDPQSKGIAYIGVYADKVSRVHDSLANPPADAPVFDQKDCLFTSPLLIFRAGTKFVAKNSDQEPHNLNSEILANLVISAGGAMDITKLTKGNVRKPEAVTCSIHPWMKAFIFPCATPYFTTTKSDGSFEIANVPAGEKVEFNVWHAKNFKGLTSESKSVKVNKGKMTVELKENETLELEFKIPANQLST